MKIGSTLLCFLAGFVVLQAQPIPAFGASDGWLQRIAFQDSMINLEISREALQGIRPAGTASPPSAGHVWYGRIVRRLPGDRVEDETHFRHFAVEYRGGAAVRAWGVTSGSGLSEMPIYSYPPIPESRSLLVSVGSAWPGPPIAGGNTPRDLVRVVLEPQADSATSPSYSVQAVYGKLGTMKVGSTRHVALLFDGNRDGQYSKDLLDGLFVDLNDDRHFDVDLGSPEFAPLRVPFELGAFGYEAVSVSPDGSELMLKSAGHAQPLNPARIGEPAPDFSFRSSDGREISLREFRGRPIVIFFWTSWCPSCRAQAVGLDNLLATYRSAGLEVVGVNVESNLDGAKTFLATYGTDWTNSFAEREVWENSTARRYGVSGPGILCLVDAKGILRTHSPVVAEVEEGLRDLLPAPSGSDASLPVKR
jgi:thiol-disulfide isomerase/thioredoxin